MLRAEIRQLQRLRFSVDIVNNGTEIAAVIARDQIGYRNQHVGLPQSDKKVASTLMILGLSHVKDNGRKRKELMLWNRTTAPNNPSFLTFSHGCRALRSCHLSEDCVIGSRTNMVTVKFVLIADGISTSKQPWSPVTNVPVGWIPSFAGPIRGVHALIHSVHAR